MNNDEVCNTCGTEDGLFCSNAFHINWEYKLISKIYGDRKARRSRVPLMNHITEGIKILQHIGAHTETIQAYCLHPVVQSDTDFKKSLTREMKHINPHAMMLAMEYRTVANSYLSHGKMSDFVGFTCPEIRDMLIADKVQNYKDFRKYHYGRHSRSRELDEYFNNWFKLLGIEYKELVKVIEDEKC